jgi:radical SAM protein with 4Fe4S-binding SPASM domain
MLEKLIKARDKRGKKFPMVSFSVTLQKANYTELQDIIRLAAGIGAESVSTVPLVAYKGLGMSDEVVDMSSGEIRDTLKLSADTADNLGVGFTVPDAGSNGESNSCKYLDSWIFVDPDGKVFPCPYWNTSQPVGDFTLNTFEQIWSGTAYNTLREHISKGILKGICSICPENRDSENIEILKT